MLENFGREVRRVVKPNARHFKEIAEMSIELVKPNRYVRSVTVPRNSPRNTMHIDSMRVVGTKQKMRSRSRKKADSLTARKQETTSSLFRIQRIRPANGRLHHFNKSESNRLFMQSYNAVYQTRQAKKSVGDLKGICTIQLAPLLARKYCTNSRSWFSRNGDTIYNPRPARKIRLNAPC